MLTTLPSLLPCVLLQKIQPMHLLDQFQPNLEKYRPKGKNEDINIVGAQGSYMKQLIKKIKGSYMKQ